MNAPFYFTASNNNPAVFQREKQDNGQDNQSQATPIGIKHCDEDATVNGHEKPSTAVNGINSQQQVLTKSIID